MRRTNAVATLGVVALIALIVGGIALLQRRDAYAFHGGELSPARAAPALDLTDQNGRPFTLDQLEGNVALVYFGYTTCPDLCPTTLSDFAAVKDALGADASRVRFVMATFDPERDTTARMKQYLAFFDPDFIGLRGTAEQTAAFEKAYGVTVKRVDYPNSATGYLLDHSALIYVIDTAGRLRLTYAYGTDPALIAQDVRHLLSE